MLIRHVSLCTPDYGAEGYLLLLVPRTSVFLPVMIGVDHERRIFRDGLTTARPLIHRAAAILS